MRFMDSLFRGITSFVSKNVTIKLKTKYNGTARDNKNFFLRILNSGVVSNNGLYLQKYNDENFVSSLMRIDWDTETMYYFGILNLTVLQMGSPSNPTPVVGGLYYNTNNKTWYKCTDGTNWVVANI